MNTYQDRLTRYAVMAVVPAAASAGYAVADFIYYGGPAIEITRSLTDSSYGSTAYGKNWSMWESTGTRSAFYGRTHGEATDRRVVGWNCGRDLHSSFSVLRYREGFQQARFEVLNNDSNKSVRIATNGAGNALRFSVSNTISSSMSSAVSFGDGTALLAYTYRTSSWKDPAHKFYYQSSSGSWALNGEGEQRGFLGLRVTRAGDDGFGWMDIGWDGTTLTIYDWAYDEDGAIHVADTGVVPGGTGLAALAMGAAGLRRRRKRSA